MQRGEIHLMLCSDLKGREVQKRGGSRTCGFPWRLSHKSQSVPQESRVWSLGWENTLEKEMATHSSLLAWEIPGKEEPGGLQSMGLQRVAHDPVTKQQQHAYVWLIHFAEH